MQAKILAAYEAPPSNGQWEAVAQIDAEILVNLIPVIVRGITLRTKPKDGKMFFGMRGMKKGEEWAQVVDFPEHGKEVQAALLEAWNAWNKQPKPQQPAPADNEPLLAFARVTEVATKPQPRPNRAMLEECPF